jgi:poly-gamma-glutamate synthesis protein (capsule biosynthesis protein)
MKLLVTGDFHISDDFGGKDLFDPSIKAAFGKADYRLVNLEAPMTDSGPRRKILKTGPHLRAAEGTVLPALRSLHVDSVTLANNHIMDYGPGGLSDTLMSLERGGIGAVGAGMNAVEAAKPLFLERSGLQAAVLNFAENEWAAATPDSPGANTLDLIANLQQIQDAKRRCEFVIVIIHGGYEGHHLPSPAMVRQYRFFAENGASAVIGHHPHCVSGHEVFKGSPIFYSLGNFVFTRPSPLGSWYEGLVLVLSLEKGREISGALIPVVRSQRDHSLTLAQGREEERIRRDVEAYSRIIADPILLSQSWEAFLSAWKDYYLGVFNPLNSISNDKLRQALYRLGVQRLFLKKRHYAEMLNHIRCEAHAEAAKAVIRRFLK